MGKVCDECNVAFPDEHPMIIDQLEKKQFCSRRCYVCHNFEQVVGQICQGHCPLEKPEKQFYRIKREKDVMS